ncbi:MAG: nuclear transport factor 2 family protein [Actinobacteria bacterium]|nr:nuclear transport factor 2 family protein [Actinomycetota bacterium]
MTIPGDRFVRALLSGDRAGLAELLGPDAVFHSPVRTYTDPDDVRHLLGRIGGLLPRAAIVRTWPGPEGAVHVVTAEQPEGRLDAVIEERRDTGGAVREVTLLLRPVKVLLPTIARMGALLDQEPLPSLSR